MSAHTEKQPQPVLTRAAIVTVVHVLAALLVEAGAGRVSSWLDARANLIALVILAAAPLVSAFLARRHVTPNARPRAADGTRLVPAGSTEAASAVVELALAKVRAIAGGVNLQTLDQAAKTLEDVAAAAETAATPPATA
jgi:hypothetical protein